jgi:trehalose-phosphatase
MKDLVEQIVKEIQNHRRFWLFLDYDGTLADFAKRPEDVIFDAELNSIIRRLARFQEAIRVVVLSGRSLRQISQLLPIPGILLAGTYGVEFITWEGKREQVVDFQADDPLLTQVKDAWTEIAFGRQGFFIEDKGVALALHGKSAGEEEGKNVFDRARRAAEEIMKAREVCILGGHRFLEVAPLIAIKGKSMGMLLERYSWEKAGVIYLGDDEKDEEAFEVVNGLGGITILVSKHDRPTRAAYRLCDPREVRGWLQRLRQALERVHPPGTLA